MSVIKSCSWSLNDVFLGLKWTQILFLTVEKLAYARFVKWLVQCTYKLSYLGSLV